MDGNVKLNIYWKVVFIYWLRLFKKKKNYGFFYEKVHFVISEMLNLLLAWIQIIYCHDDQLELKS